MAQQVRALVGGIQAGASQSATTMVQQMACEPEIRGAGLACG
jgi:hypothetical protein